MMPGRTGMRTAMFAVLCVFAVYAAAPLMLSLNADADGMGRKGQPVASIGLLPIVQSLAPLEAEASDDTGGGILILRKKRAVLRQNFGERLSKLATSETWHIPHLCSVRAPESAISRPAAAAAAARSVRGFHLSFSGSSPPLS